MARRSTNTDVSIGYWMMALFLTCIPLVNLIAIPILAFSGSNPTKKNYYRAILVWFLLIVALHVALLVAGLWPTLLKELESWMK